MAPSALRLASAELFIDTGAFIARYDADDQHHDEARAAWARLAPPQTRWRLVTSSSVIAETFTLLGRRAGFPYAAVIAGQILAASSIQVRYIDADTTSTALTLFRKYADQSVSWVDCESFALMRRAKIAKAFTFDRHFEDAGFHRFAG